jgi:hypothetical protein
VLKPFVPQFGCALHDPSEGTCADVKGAVLTRLVQLALRYVFTDQPVERLRELLSLIAQLGDQSEATRILHTLLTDYAQANPALDRQRIRTIVSEIPNGDAIMPTLAEQWVHKGQAEALLNQIEYKFGPPSETVRLQVEEADPATLKEWSRRIQDADNLDAVLH